MVYSATKRIYSLWKLVFIAITLVLSPTPASWAQEDPPAADDPAAAGETNGRPARLLRLRLPITGNADSTFRSIIDRTQSQLLAEATEDPDSAANPPQPITVADASPPRTEPITA